jgi:phosphoglycolate phosphatase
MPPRPRACAVMFDLDGTLVQTRRASWDVFRKISDEFGLGLTGPQEYFALFNGNIFASIESLCAGRADSEQVTRTFLDRLREEYNPAMVPGMVDVIRRLAGHCTLAVVSSNATEVLRRVLVGNGVAFCFAHVFGGDAVPDKTTAIRSFLADVSSQHGRRCEVAYDETPDQTRPDPQTTVLVTDTAGDVRDALDAGIRAVGVAWGMHGAEELTAAGAEFVAIWPQELPGYLIGDVPEPTGACANPATCVAAGACAPAPPARAGQAPATPAPGGCGDGECRCGCTERRPGRLAGAVSGPAAAQLAAAAVLRRERRLHATRAARSQSPATQSPATQPPAAQAPDRVAVLPGPPAGSAELRDAVRRILVPAPGR